MVIILSVKVVVFMFDSILLVDILPLRGYLIILSSNFPSHCLLLPVGMTVRGSVWLCFCVYAGLRLCLHIYVCFFLQEN